jgi:hypothetical protein
MNYTSDYRGLLAAIRRRLLGILKGSYSPLSGQSEHGVKRGLKFGHMGIEHREN